MIQVKCFNNAHSANEFLETIKDNDVWAVENSNSDIMVAYKVRKPKFKNGVIDG